MSNNNWWWWRSDYDIDEDDDDENEIAVKPNDSNNNPSRDEEREDYARYDDDDDDDNKDDIIYGTEKNDRISGDDDDNTIYGLEGNDHLQGEDGNDTILGGEGNDKLKGEDDNDALFGGEGNDKLKGGNGDDTLSGDAGNDNVKGESGDDILIYTPSEEASHAHDKYDGGKGNDTLKLVLTQAEFNSQSIQNDIAALQIFLNQNADIDSKKGSTFHFNSFNLDVKNIENLEIEIIAGSNNPPTDINLDNVNIDENTDGGIVGSIRVSDPDTQDTHTFTVDDARFEIGTSGNLKLKAGESLNHEVEDSVIVNVTATDNGGLSFTKQFTITVNDINESPFNLSLDNLSIDESSEGAIVGTLAVDDLDELDTHTFSVNDNRFEVDSHSNLKLKSGERLDFELEPTITVIITATDAGGLNKQQSFTLTVNETINDPPIAQDDLFNSHEDSVLSGNVLVNNGNGADSDSDSDGGFLSVVPDLITTSNGAIVNLLANGDFTYIPALNSNGIDDFTYTLIDGQGDYDTATVTINLIGRADTPSLTVNSASGNESTPIALDIRSALIDTDGSETLSLTITGVPVGAALSAGTDLGSGTWSLTPEQLTGLSITPVAGDDSDFQLTVTATSTEKDGDTKSVSETINVTVITGASLPTLVVNDAVGNEDLAIPLDISSSLTDTDGSETLTIFISNVPTGASLSAGLDLSGGIWQLTPSQLTGLTIQPPINNNVDFQLTITATATEIGGDTASIVETINVDVVGIADNPNLTVQQAAGNEDAAIGLNISSSLVDNDGSETLSITISGVPTGAILSAGTDQGDGVWLLTPAQLVDLSITPAANSNTDFQLIVTATSTENDGHITNTVETINVKIYGKADAPALVVNDASGAESSAIALTINPDLLDTDGSETLSVIISDVPAGATLSAGANQGNGVWNLTPAQLVDLTITPPVDDNRDFKLTITAISTENDGDSTSTVETIDVIVLGEANAPTLNVNNAVGVEDTAISLNISSSLVDTDGSETLSISIAGVPAGAGLSAGIDTGAGIWQLTPSQLSGLTITPPIDSNDNFQLTVAAIATEDDGDTASTVKTIDVIVTGEADAPTLDVNNAVGVEDTAIPLNISSSLVDIDGSETLSISIAGVPVGANLSAGIDLGSGIWQLIPSQLSGLTITPPINSNDNFQLTVAATATENDGDTATVNTTVDVTIDAAADGATISSNAVGFKNTPIDLNLDIDLLDQNGSESISLITISDLPTTASLTAGTNLGSGVWQLTPAELSGLQINPPPNSHADFQITVSVTTIEASNGDTATVASIHDVIVNLPLVDSYELSDISGTTGFAALGINANDRSGFIVSDAGDFNGDGLADFIVGSYRASPNGSTSGQSYLVFGTTELLTSAFEFSSLDGTNGFVLNGEAAGDRSGISVSGAGDVNGDGFSDIIIGAYNADPNGIGNAGSSYVIYGSDQVFTASLELSNLDGSNGFAIDGGIVSDRVGRSVSSAGDLNNDGLDDLIVGAVTADPNGSNSGQSYVIFANSNGFDSNFELTSLNGSNGFTLNGISTGDFSGRAVNTAGDINGDGFDDFLVGSLNADPNGNSNSGETYVIFGTGQVFAPTIELSALDGTNGFAIRGIDASDISAVSISSAGDFNGDGFNDILIGASSADPNGSKSGEVYVIYGTDSSYGSVLQLSLLDASQGFIINGVASNDQLGTAVSTAGDFNADGYDDLIIGALGASTNGATSGNAYVLFGTDIAQTTAIELSDLDGDIGFRLVGSSAGDQTGITVSTAGDLNGDGFDDVIVGGNRIDNGSATDAGGIYIFYGFDARGDSNYLDLATSSHDSITGNGNDNILIGGLGNDTLNGGDGNDVLIGGAGDDVLIYDVNDLLAVDGGSGEDTLQILGSGNNLDLEQSNNNLHTGIEHIDITGSGANSLNISLTDLFDLSDSSNTLFVEGNSDDTVTSSDTWTDNGTVSVAGNLYVSYTLDLATLYVDADINSNSLT